MIKTPYRYAIIPRARLVELVGESAASCCRCKDGYSLINERTLTEHSRLSGTLAQRAEAAGATLLDGDEHLTFATGGCTAAELLRRHGL